MYLLHTQRIVDGKNLILDTEWSHNEPQDDADFEVQADAYER